MNAYRIAKDEFVSSIQQGVLDNLDRMDDSGKLDPSFQRAVEAVFTLDDRGKRLELEVSDKPAEALIKVSEALRAFGFSNQMADETIEAIEEQAIHLGVDFTKKEKPTPLKIFFGIVDKEPKLDKDKVNFMVAWDRNRKYGASYSTIGASFVNRGGGKNTKMTQTNVPELENMFTGGGEKYLVFWCEKIQGDGVGGLDEKGVQATALVEAVGPVAASGAGGAAMKEKIEAGTITPQAIQLIQAVAEIKQVATSAKFEGTSERAAPKIAELKRDIPVLVNQANAAQSLPPVLVKAINQVMDMVPSSTPVQAPVKLNVSEMKRAESAPVPVAKNDNLVIQTSAPVKQITQAVTTPVPAQQMPVSQTVSKPAVTQTVQAQPQAVAKQITPTVNISPSQVQAQPVSVQPFISKPAAMPVAQVQQPQQQPQMKQSIPVMNISASQSQTQPVSVQPVVSKPVVATAVQPQQAQAKQATPVVNVQTTQQQAQAVSVQPVISKPVTTPVSQTQQPQTKNAIPVAVVPASQMQTKSVSTSGQPVVFKQVVAPVVPVALTTPQPVQQPTPIVVNKNPPVHTQPDTKIETKPQIQPEPQPRSFPQPELKTPPQPTRLPETQVFVKPETRPPEEYRGPTPRKEDREIYRQPIEEPRPRPDDYTPPKPEERAWTRPEPTPYVPHTFTPVVDTYTFSTPDKPVLVSTKTSVYEPVVRVAEYDYSSKPSVSPTSARESFKTACAGCSGGSCGSCGTGNLMNPNVPRLNR